MLKNSIIIIFLSILVSACSTTGSMALKNVSPVDIANSLKSGVTTKAQILKIMGSPNSVGITQDGLEILRYEYRRNEPMLRNFTPVVLFSFGSDTEVKQLVILLNKNKTVKEIVANEAMLQRTFGMVEWVNS